jgi:hypothetical protein
LMACAVSCLDAHSSTTSGSYQLGSPLPPNAAHEHARLLRGAGRVAVVGAAAVLVVGLGPRLVGMLADQPVRPPVALLVVEVLAALYVGGLGAWLGFMAAVLLMMLLLGEDSSEHPASSARIVLWLVAEVLMVSGVIGASVNLATWQATCCRS